MLESGGGFSMSHLFETMRGSETAILEFQKFEYESFVC